MDKRTYHPGQIVKTPGIYLSAGGIRRVALSIGERFPEAPTKGTGWSLEQRIAVEKPSYAADVPPRRPPVQPIVIDPLAMEYAIDRSYDAGWNASLRSLEARILSNGRGSRRLVLEHIAELRTRLEKKEEPDAGSAEPDRSTRPEPDAAAGGGDGD